MHGYVDPHTGEAAPLISDNLKELITEHGERLNAAIVYAASPVRARHAPTARRAAQISTRVA